MGIAAIIGVSIALMAALVIWRIVVTIRGAQRQFSDAWQRIEPIVERIRAGSGVDHTELRRLAADPVTRNLLYEALDGCKRTDLFPAEYHTPEAVAESDFVYWLRSPNALGASPDELAMVSQFKREAPGQAEVIYFLFRFRARATHPAARNGWMAGVAGGYQEKDGELKSCLPGTFSRFESYELKSPDAHVDYFHELAIRKNRD